MGRYRSRSPFAGGREEPGGGAVTVPLFMEPDVFTAEEAELEEEVDAFGDVTPGDWGEFTGEGVPGAGLGGPAEEVGFYGVFDAVVAGGGF